MAATRQETNGGVPPPGDSAKAPEPAQEVPMDGASPAAPAGDCDGEVEEPIVLHVSTLSKSEKDKIKRIVTPKATTGRLDVPKDIYELWQTNQGKEKLFAMWTKSGGVKDTGCLLWAMSPTYHIDFYRSSEFAILKKT